MVLHFAADLPAVAAGHHHIEENKRGLVALECLHRFVAVVGDGYRVPTRLEVVPYYVGVVVVVVDYKDRGELRISHLSSYFDGKPSVRQGIDHLRRWFDYQLSAVSHQPSAISHQPSATATFCLRALE